MNPSNTFSPVILDFFSLLTQKCFKINFILKLLLSMLLNILPCFAHLREDCFLFLILGYNWFSFGMLKRYSVILFATRSILAEYELQGCLSFQVRVCTEPSLNSIP